MGNFETIFSGESRSSHQACFLSVSLFFHNVNSTLIFNPAFSLEIFVLALSLLLCHCYKKFNQLGVQTEVFNSFLNQCSETGSKPKVSCSDFPNLRYNGCLDNFCPAYKTQTPPKSGYLNLAFFGLFLIEI